MKKIIISIILTCLSFLMNAQVMNFDNPSILEKKQMRLTGDWGFYCGKFIPPSEVDTVPPDKIIKVPFLWNEYYPSGLGCGTFRIKLTGLKPNTEYGTFLFDKIGTAFTLYNNQKEVITVGEPNEDYIQTKGNQHMGIVFFATNDEGVSDLVFHISNSFHRKSGIWGDISIGETVVLQRFFNGETNQRFIFVGTLFFVLLYHLSLFFFRKYDIASLYLSFFAFVIIIRIIVQGFSIMKLCFPNIPYQLALKMEYTAIFAAPLFFAFYLRHLYKIQFKYKIDYIIIILGSLIGTLMWALPIKYSNRLVPLSEIYLAISSMVLIFAQLRIGFGIKRGSEGFMVISLLLMITSAIHDIFALQLLPIFLPTVSFSPYSFILFVVFQSVITARQHEQSMRSVQLLSENLIKTNEIYYKFVPQKFLELLGKTNIVDVGLGEKAKKKLTLLCADIRDFTTISEQMSGKEIFDILNKYLSSIGPIIRANGGFIEKYLGDGIIALFPDSGEKAMNCAIEMRKAVTELRQELTTENKPMIYIGIGIHYGEVVMMTVGENDRMTGLTISKAVENVMKLEGLTKIYKIPILISQSAVENTKIKESDLIIEVEPTTNKDAFDIKEKLYTVREE